MRRSIPPRTWVSVDVWLSGQHAPARDEFAQDEQPAKLPQQADHRAAISRTITRATPKAGS